MFFVFVSQRQRFQAVGSWWFSGIQGLSKTKTKPK